MWKVYKDEEVKNKNKNILCFKNDEQLSNLTIDKSTLVINNMKLLLITSILI